ncbi:MAG: hypothetical protein ACM3VV_01200 [Deltaproteobacteria bacterium]
MLYQKTDNGRNPYLKFSKRGNKRIVLIVKDEASGTAVEVFWSALERSLELFKTRSFKELYTGAYLPPSVKQERMRFSQGLNNEEVKQSPIVSDNSSTTNIANNNKDYSVYK